MNLIKISTDLELSVHGFPTGTHEEQNNKLRELIGNDCRLYEHVMPKRLYTELHQMDHSSFLFSVNINHYILLIIISGISFVYI